MVSKTDQHPVPSEEVSAAAVGNYGTACMMGGFLLDTYLFGIFVAQSLKYLSSQAKDALWVRLLFAMVACAAILSTGYNLWIASHYFVYNFGQYQVFMVTAPLAWLALIDCVNMSLCQTFFAYRAYRLCNRNIWILISVGFCIFAGITCTITIRIMYAPLNSVLDTNQIVTPSEIWEAFTIVADAIITGCILYGLIKAKTGLAHTNRLISRLIRMTLESQAAATTLALLLLLDTIIKPENLLGISILLFHSKIYVVGLFYSLNSRIKSSDEHTVTMNNTHPLAFSRTQAATIVIDQETETHFSHVQPPAVGLNRQTLERSIPTEEDTQDAKSHKSQSSGTAFASVPSSHSKATGTGIAV